MTRTKNSFKTAKQADGALPDNSPNSIAEMLGQRVFPYAQTNVVAYRDSLDVMNLTELQNHAIEVAQIRPSVANRSILIDKLERAFLSKQALLIPQKNMVKQQVTPEGEKEIRRLLKS